MRALAVGMLLVTSTACGEESIGSSGEPLPAATFECVGEKASAIQCTTGEICVVWWIPRCPFESADDLDEKLECVAQPAECLEDSDDMFNWCGCAGYAICPWCRDSFNECSFETILLNENDDCQEPI